MAKLTVGVTPVEVPRSGPGRPVIQNLGPGTVYLDTDNDGVTTGDGLRLEPGDAFEFTHAASYETGVWLVSDTADTDVRVIVMGA